MRARLRDSQGRVTPTPFLLGVILGGQIEINLIRSIMSAPDPRLFVTRPISGALLAAAVGSDVLALGQHHRAEAKRRLRDNDAQVDAADIWTKATDGAMMKLLVKMETR